MSSYPFDTSGISRDRNGMKYYDSLPDSVVSMLRSSVERDRDQEAVVIVGESRIDYQQLWDRAARVAGGLLAAGVAKGDRVAIRYSNSMEWVVAFFGTLMVGAVVVPVNTRFTEEEAAYVIEDSAASFIFTAGSELPSGTPMAAADLVRGDLAAIFYTSGTTGFPKGAMITHGNFLSNCEKCLRVRNKPSHDPSPRTLISVPLFHVTGCNSQLLPILQQGGAAVIMPVYEVQSFLGAIAAERISNVTTVPAIFWQAISQQNFSDFDVSSVRFATYGGAPIAPDLVRRIRESFPSASAANGFGLTETSSVSTLLPGTYALSHSDSVGFPAPVVDISILEPDPQSGVGELLIRGANVVSGYWNKPAATEDTFRGGWLHTGDLARIDDGGFTYIVDRVKDMINRGGENVYCVEVENVLAAAPGVFEVSVVGVPDPMMGEKVGAVVVPTPGQPFDRDAFTRHASKHLADFKVPQFLLLRAEPLPRNAGGKVLKKELRNESDWGAPIR